ncbi:ABC-three component system protein [Pseudomonas marginalis]|uniref:ABC-three component system protein n=1 Tax=Pseudomonas marginalis TaxID=298 RepID=UPI002B1CDF34|nr:ABC-three component system protein [Pseudomonas marginalis]
MSSVASNDSADQKKDCDPYSAGEQGLGYIFQPRFALYQALELPEDTAILIEKEDDLDFLESSGKKTLASLKHKAVGERLTDLSVDFWKSVNIWLTRYQANGRVESDYQFFLFTTSSVAPDSFLKFFLYGANTTEAQPSLWQLTENTLATSKAKSFTTIKELLSKLTALEKEDFVSRITIIDSTPRIGDLPALIKAQKMRPIRAEHRDAVFERLEGWWNDLIIQMLCEPQSEPAYARDVSEKLFNFSEEYKDDNLPITFEDAIPTSPIDVSIDNRLFVSQLRELKLSPSRIRNAILDYYRAFEQRSAWARQRLVGSEEIMKYERRLTNEWERTKDVLFDDDVLGASIEDCSDPELIAVAKKLYTWAETEAQKLDHLKIRARVTEPYVLRGSFQILANKRPYPTVYWHPQLLDRLSKAAGETE